MEFSVHTRDGMPLDDDHLLADGTQFADLPL
jgi:hypothetical protein